MGVTMVNTTCLLPIRPMSNPASTVSGTYTPRDIMSATWVSLRPQRLVRVIGVLVLLLVLWSGWMGFFGPRAEPGGWLRWVVPAAALYFGFVGGVLLPLKSRRAFEQRKDLQRPCSFTASDAGLLFSTEGTTSMKPWSDYLKWKEGDAVLLLYMADYAYQIIPKRFFASTVDLEAFKAIVGQKIAHRVS